MGDNKFLLSNENANLWKFINIFKRYLNKELNGNEYFNFVVLISKSKHKLDLSKLILDQRFINEFIFNWENNFYVFNNN